MKLARISDKDGFTNVREGQGADFKIIGIINTEEFFYCESTNTEWIKVQVIKYTEKVKQFEGFIHKSRVEYIDSLPDTIKKKLILDIFEQHKRYADKFHASDSTARRAIVLALENHSDARYSPILPVFARYFCKTQDVLLLNKLFSTILADKGSANEMPSFTLGDCFICGTELVIQQLKNLKNKTQRSIIVGDIEWGLHNYFNVPEEGIGIPNTADKKQIEEFKKFKKKLEAVI